MPRRQNRPDLKSEKIGFPLLNFSRFYGPKIGPFCLGSMAFFGVFARGPLNLFFRMLFVWGLLFLVFRENLLCQPSPPIPRVWAKSFAVFIAIYVLASLAGAEPIRSLAYTGDLAIQLATFPLAWLALGQYPRIRRLIPLLYAAGLMVCSLMTLKEAGWGLVCMRAKAHLGILELGAALGQLSPIMVGALALALRKGQNKRAGFYLISLLASFIALRANCSRIAFVAAPTLAVLMFLVNWRAFGWKSKALAALLIFLAAFSVLKDQATVCRFQEIGVASGNINNDLRKAHWLQGLRVFSEHPALGNGPNAVPGLPPELIPKLADGAPAIPWKPYATAHQVFITVMAESGLIGLVVFLLLHLSPLILIRKNLLSRDPEIFFWSWAAIAVMGQFFLNCMTDHIFGLRPLMYVYWTTMATAIWLPAYRRKSSGAGEGGKAKPGAQGPASQPKA